MTDTDMHTGVPFAILPEVRRVLAPNRSALTGPGTNSYLLGECAILDPGPADPEHIDALLDAMPSPRFVFVTHTHKDHSPGALHIAQRTGARLIGRTLAPEVPQLEEQDKTFLADEMPLQDQCFEIEAGLTLRAIDTPGHVSNHVCYLHEESGLLFSGDHLLDGVTPVIAAPDGDMTAYMDSLKRLQGYPLTAIAPGHGRVLPDPAGSIEAVIRHRGRRESKIVRVLAERSGTLEALVPHVYDDVSPSLHGLARLTLMAHLVKLEREQRARCENQVWHGL
ncbi:MAG: MBL fold metallo-hydrolase [Steroidobacteraceae bacterium]